MFTHGSNSYRPLVHFFEAHNFHCSSVKYLRGKTVNKEIKNLNLLNKLALKHKLRKHYILKPSQPQNVKSSKKLRDTELLYQNVFAVTDFLA